MKKGLFIAALALTLQAFPLGVAAQTTDLSIQAHGISFSVEESKLITGDTVRIYARVRNVGQTDVSGFVSFFQGDIPIGNSQVISIRASGASEDVFVDFVVPKGNFNIRAQIQGTDPQDSVSSNDLAITNLITPIEDEDHDGVPDAQDNCPTVKNTDQQNFDGDPKGDVCDEDDDNDGLTDTVEAELGSHPRNKDTDGDDVLDPDDAYPTDVSRSKIPPPEPPPVQKVDPPPTDPSPTPAEPEQSATSQTTTTTSVISTAQATESESALTTDTLEQTEEAPIEFTTAPDIKLSPKAIFRYERLGWNRYQFEAVAPSALGYHFSWDFGDGVTSNKKQVSHTYHSYGEFKVVLTVTDPERQASQDEAVLSVSFFNIQNRVVEVLIGFLAILLLLGIVMALRLRRQPPTPVDD